MPRYLFAVRHPAYAELEDDMCGMELPDHAAARELAAKVMQGLLRNEDEDWRGWTRVIVQAARRTGSLFYRTASMTPT